MNKLLLTTLTGLMLLNACKKSESSTSSSTTSTTSSTSTTSTTATTGTTSTTNGTFTPPTTSYLKVNDQANDASADAVGCNMNGSSSGVTKRIGALNITSGQVSIHLDSLHNSSGRNIANAIPEGGYLEYTIDSTGSDAAMTVMLEFTEESDAIYFYKAGSGKIYISKKNGKLRYSTNGKVTLVGNKYLGGGGYTRQIEFSLECGAQF